MKADPADRFGIGQDAGLDGFVFAGGHLRIPRGSFHVAQSLQDETSSLLQICTRWYQGSGVRIS
jgi:hypothetical protein